MRDIGKAFLTMRAHADAWRVDMDRIALCGFSAGAHNCAMYASLLAQRRNPVRSSAHRSGRLPDRPPPSWAMASSDYHLMFGAIKDPFAQERCPTRPASPSWE
jgi:predicted esterase